MEGQQRIWQRGSSNSRRGVSGNRQQPQTSDPELDPMMSTLQKSHIASIVSGARASLQEPSRPFTPGDLGRHLFQTDEYSNRPGSSYKMKSVVGQANEEFIRDVTSASTTTTNTTNPIGRRMSGLPTNQDGLPDILKKTDLTKKKIPQKLPSITQNDANPIIPRGQIRAIPTTGGPIRPQQIQHNTQVLQISGSQVKAPEEQKQIKKVKLKKPEEKKEPVAKEDFSDLISNSGNRNQEQMRFVQQETDNLIKLQDLQKQIKQANRKRDDDECIEEEDEYEDYFAKEMMKDLEGVESYEQGIDYFSALKNIEEKVKESNQTQEEYKDDIEDDDYLMDNIVEMENNKTPYELEYADVISEMSKLCMIMSQNSKTEVKEKKIKIEEESVLELCPRIWSLSELHGRQNPKIQQSCFIETLLKGSFSLLAVKYPKAVIRLSACIINLFFKIFDRVDQSSIELLKMDLQKQFGYLCETMKALLIYAKEGQHDLIFRDENLIPLLGRVIGECYIEKSHLIIKAFTQIVNRKEIVNDDKMYDLVNYTIGTIKCFTQSNSEVQTESVKQQYIQLMQRAIQKALSFGTNPNKKSMMLVQMTGTIRNLVNDEESYKQICQFKLIPLLCGLLQSFPGHKELMLNISRVLSKLSLSHSCSQEVLKNKQVTTLLNMMSQFSDFAPFVIRIAFVLGNLTTYYEEARDQICQADGVQKILDLLLLYLSKDGSTVDETPKDQKKKELNSLGNQEDCMTKLVRLFANIATEEENSQEKLHLLRGKVEDFVVKSIDAIGKRTLEANEEFILNIISCLTNVLFYDTPKHPLLSREARVKIFNAVKGFLLATQNEEIQVESVRVLSNLSRHTQLCEEFVTDKNFLEALTIVLDHTLRDLVFYSIGIIINVTLHPESRPKVLEKQVIPKMIDVLRDSNIEDMDLSKVTAKALHNMVHENNYWTVEVIKKLDDILTNLGEELDSIMDVANEEEQRELKGLRDLVNALINDMPEPMFDCSIKECGRKFKNKEELEKHMERRHPKQ